MNHKTRVAPPAFAGPVAPTQPRPAPDNGFNNFNQNIDFLQKLNNPDFPEKGTGSHVPVWLSPKLAQDVLKAHSGTGHAIPHPSIDLKDITK